MSGPNISPELFFETANAYQKSAALKSAVELEIFTLIGEGATAQEPAHRCGAPQRGIRVLCDFLVINGFLEKQADTYRNTPDSAVFLNKKSPAYVGSAVEFLLSNELTSTFDHLTETIRKGKFESSVMRTRIGNWKKCIWKPGSRNALYIHSSSLFKWQSLRRNKILPN